MAHLPPTAAIFSPSVARIAASAAKDWNYVDSWLSVKFHGRTPPPFDRNPETLKVLLALAALNEQADEERDLLTRAETAALQELEESSSSQTHVEDNILEAVERELTRDGTTALEAMASMASSLGIGYPEPEALGRNMFSLQAKVFEIDQMKARLALLRRFVQDEAVTVDGLFLGLRGEAYKPAPEMAKQNLEAQRKIKAMATNLPELRDRVSALEDSVSAVSSPTIELLAKAEEEYLSLLAQREELQSQLNHFNGLPSDVDAARSELESMRNQLRLVTGRRDAVFEELAEQDSANKPSP